MCQYLKLSHYALKQSHYAQLCSHLFGYHYAQNYAGIIRQGLMQVQHTMCYTGHVQMAGTNESTLAALFAML